MPTTYPVIIHDLIQELATELDLHYDDEQLHILNSSVQVLQKAADKLTDAGVAVPASYDHLMTRFRRHRQ